MAQCVTLDPWISERDDRERVELEQREEEEREYQERLRKLEEQERKQRARQQEIEERERRREEERRVPEEKAGKVCQRPHTHTAFRCALHSKRTIASPLVVGTKEVWKSRASSV